MWGTVGCMRVCLLPCNDPTTLDILHYAAQTRGLRAMFTAGARIAEDNSQRSKGQACGIPVYLAGHVHYWPLWPWCPQSP